MLGCLEFPPSSLPSSEEGQLQGCLFWGTLPCLPVGRTVPSSVPATLCQVLSFAWRWVPLALAHLARCLWWIPSGCVKLVWKHGLGLAGRPWALAAWPPWALSPSPASHSPCWSWLVAQTALGWQGIWEQMPGDVKEVFLRLNTLPRAQELRWCRLAQCPGGEGLQAAGTSA